VCDEPASITDAYALIKVLSREYGVARFRVLANMTHSAHEGRELYEKLAKASDRFLQGVTLHYFGALPYDECVRRAVQAQRAVVEAYPRCRAAQVFRALAQKAAQWPAPSGARGNMEFFVERLIHPGRRGAPIAL